MTLLSFTVLGGTTIAAPTASPQVGHKRPAAKPPAAVSAARTSSAMFDSRCQVAWNAVRFYRGKTAGHRATLRLSGLPPVEENASCPRLRDRARYWRLTARTHARVIREHWAAPPEPFLSIARCEQPDDNGLHGVNWRAYSQSYEGGYGFAHTTWDGYKPAGYPANATDATILQQTNVARILVATFGGYSSWPACHRRLGLPG